MKFSIDLLAKSVLQKDTLEQCSNEEVLQLVDQYPYFGAAHLLLTKKLLAENADRGTVQLERTSLFFNNPLWLEHLINDSGNVEIIPATPLFAEEEKEQSITEELTRTPVDSPEEMTETITEQADPEPEDEEEFIEQPVMEMRLPQFKIEPIDPASAKLIFEPYHTVDYFASVGIKFKEEAAPQDKFGKQLKSFTEWLKILKKLPDAAISNINETNIEQKVEQLADQSIRDREIITEAMAYVWEKQGNTTKAIEIYNKLSLLDASKRPYFAAKIEELKKIN